MGINYTISDVEEKLKTVYTGQGMDKLKNNYLVGSAVYYFREAGLPDKEIIQILSKAAEETNQKGFLRGQRFATQCNMEIEDIEKQEELRSKYLEGDSGKLNELISEYLRRGDDFNVRDFFKKTLEEAPLERKPKITEIVHKLVDNLPVGFYGNSVIKLLEHIDMKDELAMYGKKILQGNDNIAFAYEIFNKPCMSTDKLGKTELEKLEKHEKELAKKKLQNEIYGLTGKHKPYTFDLARVQKAFDGAGEDMESTQIKKWIMENDITVFKISGNSVNTFIPPIEDFNALGYTDEEKVELADRIFNKYDNRPSDYISKDIGEFVAELYLSAGRYPKKAIEKLVECGDKSYEFEYPIYQEAAEYYESAKRLIERAESSAVKGE